VSGVEYVRLELTLETPFLPGSADPNVVDPDWPLRPSEVKGIWRWWARALIAGVLFDRGLLHGEVRHDMVKVPTDVEAGCVSRIVGRGLGLGYAGSDGSMSSCFRIRFERMNFNAPRNVDYGLTNRLQRVRLLTLGKRPAQLQYVDRGQLSITMVIESHTVCGLDNASIEAALYALALALRFSCFGKGGRRGLGCFGVRAYGRYSGIFNRGYGEPREPGELVESALNTVGKVVDSMVTKECRGLESKGVSGCELPPVPIVSIKGDYTNCVDTRYREGVKSLGKLTPYKLIIIQGGRGTNLLDVLHNFFLRPTRTRAIHGNYMAQDQLRQDLKAWILGLPREQKNPKEQKKTGYEIVGSISRRASPMLLAVHSNEAYLSVFTSADWPNKLKWYSSKPEQSLTEEKDKGLKIEINEKDIIDATAIALSEFMKYLEENKKQGIIQGVSVWP
jgi:CRISPR-associated protein Cmr1